MKLSIVIPALDEEAAIGPTLDAAFAIRGVYEIIVVDGGSRDSTVEIAAKRGARVIEAPCGRGIQMHAGALASRGEALWFLHADTLAPANAADRIAEALAQSGVAGGNFRLTFHGASPAARLLTRLYPHFRRLGLCYSDSGIFVRRSEYLAVGGFQPFPIFEDLDLVRRLKRRGRFAHLNCDLVTSSRRVEGRSFAWTFTRWTALQILYWLGVHPVALGKVYAPIRSRRS